MYERDTAGKMRFPVKLILPSALGLLVLVVFTFTETNSNSRQQARLLDDTEKGLRIVEEGDNISVREEEDVALVQERRQRRVVEVCQHNDINLHDTNIEPEMFRHLFVDDLNQFIYCEVPKVACTNWKRVMLVMSGQVNTTDPGTLRAGEVHETLQRKYLRTLNTYSPAEIRSRLENYYKFMFVRNPLERILSAYKNKFTLRYNSYFHERYGRKIIKRHRKNATQTSLEQGNDVTFKEFVAYLLDPATTQQEELNSHWRHFYQLCRPCLVQYNFIGKYETLSRDIAQVLADLHVDKTIRFPGAPQSGHRPKTVDLLRGSFSNITMEEIHKLWELYSVDFALFGYEYPELDSHH